MKLCPECSSVRWPFGVAVFISGVVAFLTWLMFSLSSVEGVIRLVGSAAVFVGVASTLAHYVVSCMKRHCRHGTEPLHHHQPAH
jgi:disulfide bond formation protein DsbB